MTVLTPTKDHADAKAGVPGLPRLKKPAHVIADDAEAIAVAERLAADFAKGASERDRLKTKPIAELDAFSQSGLWSINVPKAYGGPDCPTPLWRK